MTGRLKSNSHWLALVAVLALATVVLAETDKKSKTNDTDSIPLISGYIEKFEIPERDAKGELRTIFKGDKATFLPDGQMDVINLHAEFYTSNRLSMAINAVNCRIDQHNKRGTTDAPIELKRPDLTVTGTGADWDDSLKIINIHNNVRVLFSSGGILPAPTQKTQ
jgi:hypothetical protein